MVMESSAKLNMSAINSIAVVLDANDKNRESRELMVQLTTEMFDRLPGIMQRRLYFMGNPQEYKIGQILGNAERCFNDNCLRGSFITSVLQRLSRLSTDILHVVIIGANKIHDLEDWQGTSFSQKLLFVRLRNMGPENLEMGNIIDNPTGEQLATRMNNMISSINISGPGFMPYYWDNRGFILSINNQGQVILKGDNLTDYSVSFAFLRLGNETNARITRQEGEEIVHLREENIQIPENWGTLNEQERAIFNSAINGRSFICPICGQEHQAQNLRCYYRRGIAGEPVYQSFGDRTGFVVFRKIAENNIIFRFHPASAFRCANNMVAIKQNNGAIAYEYDSRDGIWNQNGELRTYHNLNEQDYIVVV